VKESRYSLGQKNQTAMTTRASEMVLRGGATGAGSGGIIVSPVTAIIGLAAAAE
jgi:hypothetical protein